MEQGIILGPESEQKSTKNFNQKTEHVGEDGKILNIPEGQLPDYGAFVLFATNIDDVRRVGLVHEKQDQINKEIIKAFTFEIPFEYSDDIRSIVKEQVMLQAGFETDFDHIEYLGKSYSGPNSGMFCHQFGITVDKRMQVAKTSKLPKVVDASHFWAMNEEVQHLEDWISQLTCIKRYTSKNNSIKIGNNESKQP